MFPILFMSVFPFLFFIVYLAVIFGILYLIYKWVTTFINLKREQNDILREISNKMGSK
ncbi:hypothetical protein SAMN04489722_101181 [Algibacter lectus]|nr:hypothetical protein SAMN04489722_101181 [Algibacter lectus]